MARHFIRSFVIAAALSPFVHAGPCRPSSKSVTVVSTTAETSVASGSATSSLTESLSGTSTETSVTVSQSGSATESASATSTETTLATSKTESGSTSAEQSTTSGSALSTDVTTSASESDSSTGTTLAATTSTECPEPEPPVYDDPFTHTDTEAVPATTSEAATTTEDANASIIPRNFIRRGQPVIARVAPIPTTTTAEATSTSGEATTSGETTATSQDTTATTEAANTTTEEATTTAEETTTASETTCSYDNPFTNLGFEDGKLAPWVEDPNPGGYDPVYSKVVPGGQGGSSYHFQTGQFDADKSLWLYQDAKACPGTTFTCSYAWWWNEYYAIPQDDGNNLVPYVRVYQGDTKVIGNQYPNNEGETKTWMSASFTFTMPDSGETRIWFVASSPQGEWINTSDDPCNPNWVHRSNWFALDLISCW